MLDSVQFEKNSFTNRNQIKNPNGVNWLTVPIHQEKHLSKTFNDLVVADSQNWRKKHWKSIESSYSKAPEFARHKDFFKDVYEKNWTSLKDLNQEILLYFLDILEVNTELYFLSDLGVEGKKQNLIINLCKYFESSMFLFGPEGRNYVDVDLFDSHNIEVVFHEYVEVNYSQLWGDHVPHLSAVDMLFNCDLDQFKASVNIASLND